MVTKKLKFTSRKVQVCGSFSHYVALPPEWLRMHDIKKGDRIDLILGGNSELVLTKTAGTT